MDFKADAADRQQHQCATPFIVRSICILCLLQVESKADASDSSIGELRRALEAQMQEAYRQSTQQQESLESRQGGCAKGERRTIKKEEEKEKECTLIG